MAFTNVYDVTFPADTQLANLLGSDARSLALNVQQRMAAISGLSSAMPNFAGDAQPNNWTGLLFFATDNGHVYQFNGATWVDITSNVAAARMLIGGTGSALGISANNTGYLALQVSAGPVALEPQTQIVMPQAGTFSALYILTSSAQPASGSLVITLRFGGVSQAIQVTIPTSSPAGVYSDTAHTAPFSTGSLVNYQVTNNASAASAAIQSATMVY